MRVIVCGAGKVGTSIAEQLVSQNNDVTVIDQSEELISKLSDEVDLNTIVGSASHPSILEKAGAKDADMIIAVTLQDEINMVACQMAHTFFKIPRKIARLRSEDFLNPIWRNLYNADNMPIDLIISPELEVAKSIIRQLNAPDAFEIVPFYNDKIELTGIVINENCPLIDTELRNIHEIFQDEDVAKKNLRASIVSIVRNDKLFIPNKSEKLLLDDKVYLIIDKSHVDRTMAAFGLEEKPISKLLIIGGGNIGFNIAKELEESKSNVAVTIIEQNPKRSSKIADNLNNSLVLNGDGLDQDLLEEANIASTDMILALTDDDETNIIISAIARKNKCKSLILINNSDYNNIKDVLGIDRIIDPRMTTVSKILKHVHKGSFISVYTIGNGEAEIIHAKATKSSQLLNKSLKEADLPDGIKIGIIAREQEIIIPNKNTVIEVGDNVTFITMTKDVAKAEELFKVRGSF
jgi:trk system potassium uptake protein TrkA